MRKSHFIQLDFVLVFAILMSSCESEKPATSSQRKPHQHNMEQSQNESKEEEQEAFDMTNPAFMMGTNIGSLFKTYYKVGDFTNMVTITSSTTIKKYGREKLLTIYRELNLGFDMAFKKMTVEGNEKILHYEVVIHATKQVKRLHVVIENDTARIVPQHLERGDIFE